MRKAFFEMKIIGPNLFIISAIVTIAFVLICLLSGNNTNWAYLGFEVIFPFFSSIMIGEWNKFQSDPVFYVISAQSNSLFSWIVTRFLSIYLTLCIFSLFALLGAFMVHNSINIFETIVIYLSTSFFLCSISALFSVVSRVNHIATMITGLVWFFSLMSRSLLRFRPVPYVYLFIRYVGNDQSIWMINKTILVLISFCIWILIFYICRYRPKLVF